MPQPATLLPPSLLAAAFCCVLLRAAASCYLELLPSRRHGRTNCSAGLLRAPPA